MTDKERIALLEAELLEASQAATNILSPIYAAFIGPFGREFQSGETIRITSDRGDSAVELPCAYLQRLYDATWTDTVHDLKGGPEIDMKYRMWKSGQIEAP